MSYRTSGHKQPSDVVKALRQIRPYGMRVDWRPKASRGVRRSLLLRAERKESGETRRQQDARRAALRRAELVNDV